MFRDIVPKGGGGSDGLGGLSAGLDKIVCSYQLRWNRSTQLHWHCFDQLQQMTLAYLAVFFQV